MLPSRNAPLRRARRRARIVLITAARDRHARQLRAAFLRRDVEAVLMPLEACLFDTVSPTGLRLGGFDGLPDGVFVRTIAEGSFEAVTRRLGILHALKALGLPVWNEAGAIERCVDKSMTTFLLARAGLPVPATWAVEGIEAARRIVAAEASGGPLVLKPLFGAQGRGLMLIRDASELPPAETLGSVYYLQRFVGGDGPDYHDFRVFVIEGEPVAAMLRHSRGWITNVKRGGQPMATPLDTELAGLASDAARAVGAAFCGVDIIRGRDHRPYVLEVNSMPAWSGLQMVTSVQIADFLAERFIATLRLAAQAQVA